MNDTISKVLGALAAVLLLAAIALAFFAIEKQASEYATRQCRCECPELPCMSVLEIRLTGEDRFFVGTSDLKILKEMMPRVEEMRVRCDPMVKTTMPPRRVFPDAALKGGTR